MAELDDLFGDLEDFEWDAGESDKHWIRHEVRQSEAEQALLNTPVVVKATTKHGSTEQRFVALGLCRGLSRRCLGGASKRARGSRICRGAQLMRVTPPPTRKSGLRSTETWASVAAALPAMARW